ncbi:MAG TPA: group 1 truncated hemoglobin [Woeseiaceae bacterium]
MQTAALDSEASLYERLGGASGISALVDDIVEAHLANPHIRARFVPFLSDPERVASVKRHLRDFFGAGSGGPERYQGRSMPDAHRGMNVSATEYMAAVDDILRVLGSHGIDPATQKDVLAIAWSLKAEIMHL